MKRKPNRKHVPTIVQDYLMALVATGLYGATVEEVGYRLICEGDPHWNTAASFTSVEFQATGHEQLNGEVAR